MLSVRRKSWRHDFIVGDSDGLLAFDIVNEVATNGRPTENTFKFRSQKDLTFVCAEGVAAKTRNALLRRTEDGSHLGQAFVLVLVDLALTVFEVQDGVLTPVVHGTK